MLTQERLKQVLHYDPETGLFIRIDPDAQQRYKVGLAGSVRADRYVQIVVDGRSYLAHRLAWLYVYGVWPHTTLDHRDLNPSNNRLLNLREATHKQNSENKPEHPKNKSGFRGVSWHSKGCKWLAQICHQKVHINLGLYSTKEAASQAYETARNKLFTHHR